MSERQADSPLSRAQAVRGLEEGGDRDPMKQNISPATAAIIAVVVVAVIALAGYKYFVSGSSKGTSSATDKAKMSQTMATYGQNQRAEEEKHHMGTGSMN